MAISKCATIVYYDIVGSFRLDFVNEGLAALSQLYCLFISSSKELPLKQRRKVQRKRTGSLLEIES